MSHRFSLGIDLGHEQQRDRDHRSGRAIRPRSSKSPKFSGRTGSARSRRCRRRSTSRIPTNSPQNAFPLPWARRRGRRARSSATSRATTARWFPIASSPRPSRGCRTRTSTRGSGRCRGNRTIGGEALGVRLLAPLPRAPQARAFSTPSARKAGSGTSREGQIVLTVPASFDEVARNLTAEAAEAAGLGKVILLEEPLAAFYAWTAQAGKEWRAQVGPGDIVLVCDVGGGTADFSLIAVTERDGELALERISVGEHILLGGDNMDLALAYTLRAQARGGRQGDRRLAVPRPRACRRRKPRWRCSRTPRSAEVPIAVPSRGSSLLAGTRIDEARPGHARAGGPRRLLRADRGHRPAEGEPARRAAGIRPALRLRSRRQQASGPLPHPQPGQRASERDARPRWSALERGVRRASDADGGAVQRRRVQGRRRSASACSICWRPGTTGEPVRELEGFQPDLAVAKGASFYGRNRVTGKGIRIKAGAARSYYIGLETSMPAVPGFKPPVKALCVVPQGMEEGSELLIEGQEFGLVTGAARRVPLLLLGGAQRRQGRADPSRRRARAGGDQPARGRSARRRRSSRPDRRFRCRSTRSSPNSAISSCG